MHHFPTDPSYANVTLKVTASEISSLGSNVLLSTTVLDVIIQSAALSPEVSEDRVPPILESLGSVAHVQPLNVVLPPAASNPHSTRQFDALMTTSAISTTASMKRDDDNDSGTTDTASYRII